MDASTATPRRIVTRPPTKSGRQEILDLAEIGDGAVDTACTVSVMKCCNPNCNHGIGLVAYRPGWFGKRLYCSKNCRNAFVVDNPKHSQQDRSVATYFEWLLRQPDVHLRPQMMPASLRVRALKTAGGLRH
jgi:hypothetical protein